MLARLDFFYYLCRRFRNRWQDGVQPAYVATNVNIKII